MTIKIIFYTMRNEWTLFGSAFLLKFLWGLQMKLVRFIALLLIVVGAINWGLWGLFQFDLIQALVGSDTSIWARILYTIVGLAGVYGICFFFVPHIYCCCKGKCKHEE